MTAPISTRTLIKSRALLLLDTTQPKVSALLDTWLNLVEQLLNRRFVPPAAWSRRYHVINSASENARFITLPLDTVRVTRVHINTPPYAPLDFYTPSALMRKYPYFELGKPQAYTILGEVLELSHRPDQDYELTIVSRQRIWELGRDVQFTNVSDFQKHVQHVDFEVEQNYWTAHCPDVLLYGLVMHGFAHLEDERKMGEYRTKLNDALGELEKYINAKAFTPDQGVAPPTGVMIV